MPFLYWVVTKKLRIMSYHIYYDKQFIKAEKDGKEVFFPMMYSGDNNCYEVGTYRSNGRRARDWGNNTYFLGGKFYGTLEEMLAGVEAYKNRIAKNSYSDDEYSDEKFGWYAAISFGGGCRATYGQFKGLFITGCKKALTVEELRDFGVTVSINSYIYSDKNRAQFEAEGQKDIYFVPKTSAELVEKIEELREYIKGYSYVSLYMNMDANERTMKRIRKEKFPTKRTRPSEYVDVDEYFVIDIKGYGYFHKATRSGFRYSPYESGGKHYINEKAAKKQIKRFVEKNGSRYSLEVKNVKQKTRLKV